MEVVPPTKGWLENYPTRDDDPDGFLMIFIFSDG
jgi:hypothetical protein